MIGEKRKFPPIPAEFNPGPSDFARNDDFSAVGTRLGNIGARSRLPISSLAISLSGKFHRPAAGMRTGRAYKKGKGEAKHSTPRVILRVGSPLYTASEGEDDPKFGRRVEI